MDTARWWLREIARAEATLLAIEAFVAPSPRREAWIASTERALALMIGAYARRYRRDAPLLRVDAGRLVEGREE